MSLEVPFLLSNSWISEIFHCVKSAFYFVLILLLSKGIVMSRVWQHWPLCCEEENRLFCLCTGNIGVVCSLIYDRVIIQCYLNVSK